MLLLCDLYGTLSLWLVLYNSNLILRLSSRASRASQYHLLWFASLHFDQLESCLEEEEYQSFFWQTKTFSLSTPYSFSSLRHPHFIPLAMVATASTKQLDSRIIAYPLGLKIRSISNKTYFISHLSNNRSIIGHARVYKRTKTNGYQTANLRWSESGEGRNVARKLDTITPKQTDHISDASHSFSHLSSQLPQ